MKRELTAKRARIRREAATVRDRILIAGRAYWEEHERPEGRRTEVMHSRKEALYAALRDDARLLAEWKAWRASAGSEGLAWGNVP